MRGDCQRCHDGAAGRGENKERVGMSRIQLFEEFMLGLRMGKRSIRFGHEPTWQEF